MRRDWKRIRPISLVHAMRLCTEFALERHNLSVARIADRMGVSLDCLYKWLATGKLPAVQIPTLELACGCSYVSTWLAMSAGKLVIDQPKGRKASDSDLVEFNTGFAEALQMLGNFHQGKSSVQETLLSLQRHLEQAAWHHANVATHATPELEFGE
jgi:hypothetical protein